MRVVFAGTPEFAATSLRELLSRDAHVVGVLTQPDRPAGRGRRLSASPVKQLAVKHELAVQQPLTLKDAETRAALAALAPDLMVVAAYGLLLPQSVLDMPKLGCVNIHASLLPRWRGAAPIQRAIEHGDTETGVCLMQMEAGLDTGPVLARSRCPIGARETAGELHDRLAMLGASLLGESLPALQQGRLAAEPQPGEGASYATRLHKSEAWIDWCADADLIGRRVRAFNPWPVACTSIGGEQVRIWRAAEPGTVNINPLDVEPGTLVQADRRGLVVACGRGALTVEELQFPGGRRLTALDVVNAGRIAAGSCFEHPPSACA